MDLNKFLEGIPVAEIKEQSGDEIANQFGPDLNNPLIKKQIGLARKGIACTIRGDEIEIHAEKDIPDDPEIEQAFQEYLQEVKNEKGQSGKMQKEIDELRKELAELKKNQGGG